MESRSVKVIGGVPELDAFQAWILGRSGGPGARLAAARKTLSERQAAEQAEADA